MRKVLFVLLFSALTVCSQPAMGIEIDQTLGMGIGLPYGGLLGLNYELGLGDWFAPTAGVGLLENSTGWNVGGRFYYPGRKAVVRGRLTALYGTNATLDPGFGGDKEALEGFSGGLGITWRYSNNWGMAADIFLADVDKPPFTTGDESQLLIALGFTRRW